MPILSWSDLRSKIWSRQETRLLWWAGIFFVILVLLAGIEYFGPPYNVQAGQPSPRDFLAPQSISYQSEVLTQEAMQEAIADVKQVYRVDDTITDNLVRDLVSRIEAVRLAVAGAGPWPSEIDLPPGIREEIAAGGPEEVASLQPVARDILRAAMRDGVQRQSLAAAREEMLAKVDALQLAVPYQELLKAIFTTLPLQANLVYDPEATEGLLEKARRTVQPVQVTVRQHEKIVDKGEIITPAQLETLQKLGLVGRGTVPERFVGLVLLVAALFGLAAVYLVRHHPEIIRQESRVVLLGLLVVITVGLSRLVLMVQLSDQPEIAAVGGYLVPVAAGSMLITILLGRGPAIFFTAILAALVGIMVGGQFSYSLVALAGGMAGVYSVDQLNQRADLVRACLYIMLANVVVILGLGLLFDHPVTSLAAGALIGVANGLFSTVLTIGSLPFWETAFGVTTSVRLLELSNPNRPLLKRLLLEAPGTYHHSLMVGNLAETAADALGADSLLARVGAYYHDIGKLKRPYFFVENQFTRENPHDKLTPSLSTLIITSHVKDGLELAREAGLPQVIQDIIAQHHGTSLVSYFYQKASEREDGLQVSKDNFRYECQKPQTKESALVMLADGVEAGVRSIQNLTPGRMEGFVRKLIREKLEDGQLDECDLTLRELDLIAQSFIRALSGIFHSRIEYPEAVLKEMERRKDKSAALRKQSTG